MSPERSMQTLKSLGTLVLLPQYTCDKVIYRFFLNITNLIRRVEVDE